MTAKELYEQLKKCGLENAPLVYPNWIYEQAPRHNAHVVEWHELKNGEVFLGIDVKEDLQ